MSIHIANIKYTLRLLFNSAINRPFLTERHITKVTNILLTYKQSQPKVKYRVVVMRVGKLLLDTDILTEVTKL